MAGLKDTIGQRQQFVHGGTDNDLTGFTLGLEAFAERPHNGVMLASDHCREVEGVVQ